MANTNPKEKESAVRENIEQTVSSTEKFFSENRKNIERIHSSLIFGGGCVNDAIMHLVSHTLPFGGVGDSGLGSYHGKRTFMDFSHEKGMLDHATWLDITLRSAPFGRKEKIIKTMLH